MADSKKKSGGHPLGPIVAALEAAERRPQWPSGGPNGFSSAEELAEMERRRNDARRRGTLGGKITDEPEGE